MGDALTMGLICGLIGAVIGAIIGAVNYFAKRKGQK